MQSTPRTTRATLKPTMHAGIGIYVRKSTDKQELSLPAQERLIRQFLQHHMPASPIHSVYRDIVSGRRPDRAGYQQLLTDARAGKLAVVAFHKVNRFGRNTAEGLAAVNELRHLGVKVLVVDLPNLDIDTPTGMLIFSILLSQGQFEVENLGTEARKGMEYKATQGGWPFRAPDGYSNQREEIGHHKFRSWVAINRPRAALIRLIFCWYRSGHTTLAGIAQRLNHLHARRTTQGRTGCLSRHGKTWTPAMIFRVLTNRFYIGEITIPTWNIKQRGTHPPIIRPATFAAVQTQLHRNGLLHNTQHTYLLQDRLWLAHTEPPIAMYCTQIQRPDQVYRYYYHYRGTRRVYYDVTAIDHQVVCRIQDRIATLGSDPMSSIIQRVRFGVAELRAHAHTALTRLAGDRERLLYLGRTGFFSEPELAVEMQRLIADEQAARTVLAQSEQLASNHSTHIATTSTLLTHIATWNQHSLDEQRAVLVQIIDRVEMNADGHITKIDWQPFWELLWFGASQSIPHR